MPRFAHAFLLAHAFAVAFCDSSASAEMSDGKRDCLRASANAVGSTVTRSGEADGYVLPLPAAGNYILSFDHGNCRFDLPKEETTVRLPVHCGTRQLYFLSHHGRDGARLEVNPTRQQVRSAPMGLWNSTLVGDGELTSAIAHAAASALKLAEDRATQWRSQSARIQKECSPHWARAEQMSADARARDPAVRACRAQQTRAEELREAAGKSRQALEQVSAACSPFLDQDLRSKLETATAPRSGAGAPGGAHAPANGPGVGS